MTSLTSARVTVFRGGAALVLGLVLAGCVAPEKPFLAPNFHALAPRRVAVLPPENATAQVAGATLLQYLMGQHLPSHGYWVRDVNETLATLESKGAGLTIGGRLGSWADGRWLFPARPSPEQLCQDLDVDGLFVGKVDTYDYVELVFARTRVVQCKWMLVDRKGTPLWFASGRGQTAEVDDKGKEGLKAAAANVAIRAIEDAQGIPLFAEAQASIQDCLASLPHP